MTSEQPWGQGAQHLIGDVQRFGLMSAAAVVDRYTEIIDRATRDGSFPLPPAPADERVTGSVVDSTARIAEAYLSLLDASAALIVNRATPATSAPAMERLILPPTNSGSSSEMSLWVHNPTSAAVTGIDISMTNLISSSGVCIPISSVSLSPEQLDIIDGGSSREVSLLVEVPADQPAGNYHGLVVISAAPMEPFALRLDVDGCDRPRYDDHQ